jgi:hypothetical protein
MHHHIIRNRMKEMPTEMSSLSRTVQPVRLETYALGPAILITFSQLVPAQYSRDTYLK